MKKHVQILSTGHHKLLRLPTRLQEHVRSFNMVSRVTSTAIFLHDWAADRHVSALRRSLVEAGYNEDQIRVVSDVSLDEVLFDHAVKNERTFRGISFGSDLAEEDTHLSSYFVQTDAYSNVLHGNRTLVIGPKGSGKTAILRALVSNVDSNYSVVITPERYAKTLLKDILQQEASIGSDVHAYTAAWTYTILLEVFKQALANKKGLRTGPLGTIHAYVRDNVSDAELDLLSRFVAFWRRIEGVKIGPVEVSLKARQLEQLYSLQPILALLPSLQKAVGNKTFYIVVDELDQGWDNTDVSNSFLVSLLLTAIRLHSYKTGIKVIAFLRTEIFDILKRRLDQLDKMRGSIETIHWARRSLADLVTRRAAFSIKFQRPVDPEAGVKALFPESIPGSRTDGFGYLLSRTTMRPREVIQFARLAHQEAANIGATSIGPKALLNAEEEFSTWKTDHLISEYLHILPGLDTLLERFRQKQAETSYRRLTDTIVDWVLEREDARELPTWASGLDERSIAKILFDVSFIGFREGSENKTKGLAIDEQFVFAYRRSSARLREDRELLIHPGFWKHLEITL